MPSLSVVVPNYNGGATLERTLCSLVEQDYPALQIIAMDSASTDNSREILERYRDRLDPLVIEKDRGQADGLNKGFTHARGEIRAWLCSDDELTPGALRHVGELFAAHPEADVVIGACQRVFSDGATVEVRPSQNCWENLNVLNGVDQPSVFWRAGLHEKIGPLDESFHLAFDWDFWNRMRRAGARPLFTNRNLSRYYFSVSNKSGNSGSKHADEHFRIVREYGPRGLAHAFRFIYRHFDLKGCYDKPRTSSPLRTRAFYATMGGLSLVFGRKRLYQYNWHFASCQERGLRWW